MAVHNYVQCSHDDVKYFSARLVLVVHRHFCDLLPHTIYLIVNNYTRASSLRIWLIGYGLLSPLCHCEETFLLLWLVKIIACMQYTFTMHKSGNIVVSLFHLKGQCQENFVLTETVGTRAYIYGGTTFNICVLSL